jgi:hypothetical protein
MADVYSTRFISAVGLTGTSSYTVPNGFVAIIRDLDAYANPIGVVSLYLHGASGEALWWNSWDALVAAYASFRGRQVIFAGETFNVEADVTLLDSVDVAVSGYLLSA